MRRDLIILDENGTLPKEEAWYNMSRARGSLHIRRSLFVHGPMTFYILPRDHRTGTSLELINLVLSILKYP